MELKLFVCFRFSYFRLSFNRTFMELKLTSLLILRGSGLGFNRTFMELKYVCVGRQRRRSIVLIVPLWN